MNEIVEFITDRVAERAAEAHLVHALGCDALSPCADGCCPMGTCDCGEPERILADIEAKQEILGECSAVLEFYIHGDAALRNPTYKLCWNTARRLAAPYADQPGFKYEWRIDAWGAN